MAIYAACTVDLAPEAIKVRWQEPYVTSGLNQKTLGQQAKGVFAGFTVEPGPGGTLKVLLKVDPTLGFSGANVLDVTTSKYCVTVIQSSTITVDLASVANGTVYITLDAQYQIGATSGAQVKVVDAAELATNANLVLLAKVNVPAVPDILSSHINMGYRLSVGDSLPAEAQPRVNLINNPSMETGDMRGWGSNDFLVSAASTDFPRTGSYSQKLVIAAPDQPWVDSTPMPVTPGRKYRASAWFRSVAIDPIVGVGAELEVVFLDTTNTPIGIPVAIEGVFLGGGTTYVQRQAEIVAPALAASAMVRVQYLSATGGTLYVDDIEFSTHVGDQLAQSALFGGNTSNADWYHSHSSSSQLYGGGVNWADTPPTPNPANTVEGQLDKILIDLAGAGGAARIGNAPSKILPNTFTKPNTITNSVTDVTALVVTGLGTGAAIEGTSGATPAVGVIGVAGVAGGEDGFGISGGVAVTVINGTGVRGIGKGTGPGVLGVTTTDTGFAIEGRVDASAANGTGLLGVGKGNAAIEGWGAAGVDGRGGANGSGVYGLAGGTAPGGLFVAGASSGSYGVVGSGSLQRFVPGGHGVKGSGTGTVGIGGRFYSSSDAVDNVSALEGHALNANGTGVDGLGTGDKPGVRGHTAGTGAGVSGTNTGTGWGMDAQGGAGKAGIHAIGGTGGGGVGVWGIGGSSGTVGVLATGSGASHGLEATRGDLDFKGVAIKSYGSIDMDASVQPTILTTLKNKITRQSFSKAGVFVTLNGTATPGFGEPHGIGILAQDVAGIVTITFLQPMATTGYRIQLFREFWPTAMHGFLPSIATKLTTGITLVFLDNTGAGAGLAALSTTTFSIEFFGDQ